MHQVGTSHHSDLVGFSVFKLSIDNLIFRKLKKKHGILLKQKAVYLTSTKRSVKFPSPLLHHTASIASVEQKSQCSLFSLDSNTNLLLFSWLHNVVIQCTCKVYFAVNRIWGWHKQHTSEVISSLGEMFLALQEATGHYFYGREPYKD